MSYYEKFVLWEEFEYFSYSHRWGHYKVQIIIQTSDMLGKVYVNTNKAKYIKYRISFIKTRTVIRNPC